MLLPVSSAADAVLASIRALGDEVLADPEVCVAVLDGPVDVTHPCFRGANLRRVQTLVKDPADRGAMSAHGTHVASVIFGQPLTGTLGLAAGCRGLSLPVFRDKSGYLSQLDLARAIEQAVLEGAHVINVSGGEKAPNGDPDPILARALKLCEQSNVLVVAAAGNDGCDCVHVPAAVRPTLAVGAMNRMGVPLESSNFGEQYQVNAVLAPGERIPGAVPGGGIAAFTGSSFATPIVSALAALLMSAQRRTTGEIDAQQVRDAILDTAIPCQPSDAEECARYLAGTLNVRGADAFIRRGGRTEVTEFDARHLSAPTEPAMAGGPGRAVVDTRAGIAPSAAPPGVGAQQWAGAPGQMFAPGAMPSTGGPIPWGWSGGLAPQWVAAPVAPWGPGVAAPSATPPTTGAPGSPPGGFGAATGPAVEASRLGGQGLAGAFTFEQPPAVSAPVSAISEPRGADASGDCACGGADPSCGCAGSGATASGATASGATASGATASQAPPPTAAVPVAPPPGETSPGPPLPPGAAPGRGTVPGISRIFAIGNIGYDFGTEARRDSFRQLMAPVELGGSPPVEREANPFDVMQLYDYFEGVRNPNAGQPGEPLYIPGAEPHRYDSTKVIWTLNLELTPVYAIEAEVPYAEDVYRELRRAMRNQALPAEDVDYVSRVSIPGILTTRTVRLFSGQEVPVVVAQPRGLYVWNETALVNAVIAAVDPAALGANEDVVRLKVRQMLDKIYYQLRNLGQSPPDRAINFQATNAFIFAEAIARGLLSGKIVDGDTSRLYSLDSITAVKSPYCRMDSDCWDVQLSFFDPDNDNRARVVLQSTIDVSDELPVQLAPTHTFLNTG